MYYKAIVQLDDENTYGHQDWTKVCFKSFVTWIIKLYNFSNTWSGSIIQIVLESLSEEQH